MQTLNFLAAMSQRWLLRCLFYYQPMIMNSCFLNVHSYDDVHYFTLSLFPFFLLFLFMHSNVISSITNFLL